MNLIAKSHLGTQLALGVWASQQSADNLGHQINLFDAQTREMTA